MFVSLAGLFIYRNELPAWLHISYLGDSARIPEMQMAGTSPATARLHTEFPPLLAVGAGTSGFERV
jgi:hypothetical protein